MRKFALLLPLLFMAMVNCSYGQNIFIKIDNAEFVSEVQQTGFKDHLEALTLSYGLALPTDQGGTITGVPRFNNIAIMKNITQNSPLFNLMAARKNNIPKIEFKYVSDEATPKTRYMVTIENVLITSISGSLDGSCTNCQIGMESITFHYTEIIWTYYDANGNVQSTHNWNLQANTGG